MYQILHENERTRGILGMSKLLFQGGCANKRTNVLLETREVPRPFLRTRFLEMVTHLKYNFYEKNGRFRIMNSENREPSPLHKP